MRFALISSRNPRLVFFDQQKPATILRRVKRVTGVNVMVMLHESNSNFNLNTSHIHTVMLLVSPKLAESWLKLHNKENRPLRQARIDAYAECIKNGDWKVTHQGIAFSAPDSKGSVRLLDGQHRLNAIIKAGKPVWVNVSYGLPDDSFEAIDHGLLRSDADRTGLSPALIGISRHFVQLTSQSPTKQVSQISPRVLREYASIVAPKLFQLQTACNATAKIITATTSKAAVIGRMMLHPDHEDYLIDLYRRLVIKNTTNIPPIGAALLNQLFSGKIVSTGSSGRNNLFARMWTVYDPAKRDITRVQVRDTDLVIRSAGKALSRFFRK